MNFPRMRHQMEIQRAHDTLQTFLNDKALCPDDYPDRKELTIAAAVLCWTLNHGPGTFGEIIRDLVTLLEATGYFGPDGEPYEVG
jgi:hypothetical protein